MPLRALLTLNVYVTVLCVAVLCVSLQFCVLKSYYRGRMSVPYFLKRFVCVFLVVLWGSVGTAVALLVPLLSGHIVQVSHQMRTDRCHSLNGRTGITKQPCPTQQVVIGLLV